MDVSMELDPTEKESQEKSDLTGQEDQEGYTRVTSLTFPCSQILVTDISLHPNSGH